MRAYWTVILLSLMIHASMGTVDSASAPPKISVETPIYFSAADGSEMLLTPHVYSVQSRDPFLEMRPVGADRKETILLNATIGTHQESVGSTTAFLTTGDEENSYHLVLLKPEGTAYEAIGTTTSLRSRGTTTRLTPIRVQSLLQNLKSQTVPLNRPPLFPIPTIPPSEVQTTNPCVRDVREDFLKIRTHGDKLGFRHTQSPGAYTGSGSSHYQGIQRLGNYLAISGSAAHAGEIMVVEMQSRAKTGRFRSNRLSSNTPPNNDRVIKVIEASRTLTHAGGFQIMGEVLAVGVEGSNQSEVVFYNIKDPTNPQELYRISRSGTIGGFSEKPSAGATALVQRPDGRFLLLVGRSDSNVLDFYLSRNANILTNTFVHVDSWHEHELQGMDREFGNYQNINFVRQCDGQVFVVGLHKNVNLGGILSGGEDWADLFKLELLQIGQIGNPGILRHHTVVTKIANRHLYCHDICDFDAGAGVYVDSQGELFIYGVEHWRHKGIVRFNEFRPVPSSVSPPLLDLNQTWIELYDDRAFGDRSIMIDFRDHSLRNFSDYDQVEGFEDKTSSAKWVIPSGWQYLLFEDKSFKGRLLRLSGTGGLGAISDFSPRDWNDTVSSSKFSPVTITQLGQAWVELFDDHTFKDRRLRINGGSAGISNYQNITVEGQRGFGDNVSSARYMIPNGLVYRLYEHDSYRGKTLDLVGTGRIEEIPDFTTRSFNDQVSSSRFITP